MAIIGNVGRKSIKVRSLNISIHLLLLFGAITMIYPFMIMVSSSFKSNVDSKNFSLYPKYFFDDEMLYKKYIEARLNEESNILLSQYKNSFLSFEFLKIPEKSESQLVKDWNEFITENGQKYSVFDYYISEQFGRGVYPKNERKFRQLIKSENQNSIDVFNENYNTPVTSWDEVRIEEREILSRNFSGNYSGLLGRYSEFRQKLPIDERVFASLDGYFITQELNQVYQKDLEKMNQALNTEYKSWSDVTLSKYLPESNIKKHWINFVKNILNIRHIGVTREGKELYNNYLNEKYDDITLLNSTYKTNYVSFEEIPLLDNSSIFGASLVDWTFFIENIVPPKFLFIKSVEFDFRDWLQNKYGKIETLNDVIDNGYKMFEDVKLSKNVPQNNLQLKSDWIDFVQNHSSDSSKELLMTCQNEFHDFLKFYYPKNGEIDLETYNKVSKNNFQNTLNIYPSVNAPQNEFRKLWLDFYDTKVSPIFLQINTEAEEKVFQEYLKNKYQNIEELNSAYNLKFVDFDKIGIDYQNIDYHVFKKHKKTIFKEMTKRNYLMVLDVMLYNGHAIVNTLIYCFLAILVALIVNPLAAYAMSRFKLKASYKIILLLMLTMAFPPMVMGIPNFLLLKKFNLLNTFFALILPAAADGYFIFLLKGFFDSLPQELFESATIDGAGEVRIFWQIAMALSKPIMAVIALGAFNAAYRNFMFAFIVCQDKSMWTMMVHIYQLMQRSSAGVGFAALVIAAIPTFVVFVFFQNIIIKGIVVPTEK